MDSIISKNYPEIKKFDVSRETCNDFESLISMIQKKNEKINIISKKTLIKRLLDKDILLIQHKLLILLI